MSLCSRRADLNCSGIPQAYIRVKSISLSPKETAKRYGFAAIYMQTNLYLFLFCRIMTRIIVHEILSAVFLNLLYTSIHSGKTIVGFLRNMFLKKQIIHTFWCNKDMYMQNIQMFVFCTRLLIFKGLVRMPCRYS